ncbi:hypothetical protein GF367_02930 [Candidatus Woesearchaeota archaeon]|nr:hypothetical protein [Candidatus Woesearchaeota archaeon]
MRKRKQGGMFGQITKIALLTVFLAVLVIVFFSGPGAVFDSIKRMIPTPTDWVSRDGYDNPDVNSREAQDLADKAAAKIGAAYHHLAEDPYTDGCFYYLSNKEISYLDKYELHVKDTGSGVHLSLRRPTATEEGTVEYSPIFDTEIEGVEPCLVYGEPEAKHFYDYWLAGEASHPGNHFRVFDEYYVTGKRIVIIGGDEAKLRWEGKDKQAQKSFILYKYGDNICMFPSKAHTFDLFTLRCQARDDLLDRDCFRPGAKSSLHNMPSNDKLAVWSAGKCRSFADTLGLPTGEGGIS